MADRSRPTRVRVVLVVVVIVRGGDLRALVRQWQQRVALGAGEAAAPVLAGKEHDEGAREEQAEEKGDRDDGHAWNVVPPTIVFSGLQRCADLGLCCADLVQGMRSLRQLMRRRPDRPAA